MCFQLQPVSWYTVRRKYDCVSPIVQELYKLSAAERIDYKKILLLTFNSSNDMVLIYLQELLLPYIPPKTLRSSSKFLLVTPRCNLRIYGQRAFWYIIHSIHITWNSFQVDMRRCMSLTIFKSILKTFLHERIFSGCVAYF